MSRIKRSLLSISIAGAALIAPTVAATASPATSGHPLATGEHKHACTKTSTGHCIRGGEFCPESKYGKSGWDAKGRRYVCKGPKDHPHWEKP